MTWFDRFATVVLLILVSAIGTAGYKISRLYKQDDIVVKGNSNFLRSKAIESRQNIISDLPSSNDANVQAIDFTVSAAMKDITKNRESPFSVTKAFVQAEEIVTGDLTLNQSAERGYLPLVEDRDFLISRPSIDTSNRADQFGKSTKKLMISEFRSNSLTGQQSNVNGNVLGSISGRVVSGSGDPISDFVVYATSVSERNEQVKTARTNNHGKFNLVDLKKGEYLIRTQEHPLFSTLSYKVRAGAKNLQFKLHEIDFVDVIGHVVDLYGQPVVGAKLMSREFDDEIISDKNGEINSRITVSEGKGLLLMLEAPGYLPENLYFSTDQWSLGEPVVFEKQLRRGNFEILGYIYDEQGYPVSNALVQINSRRIRLHRYTQTDGEGKFSIDQVIASNDFVLKVSAGIRYRDYTISNFALSDGMGSLQIPLDYSPIGGLKGNIVDESSLPIQAVSLKVTSKGASGRAATIDSDESGRYTLQNFVAGTVELRSRTAPEIIVKDLDIVAGLIREQDIVVDLGDYDLHGMITDNNGLPIPNAAMKMRYYRKDPTGYTTTVNRKTSSNEEGEFQFNSLGSGQRSIYISANGYRSKRVLQNPALLPGPLIWILER